MSRRRLRRRYGRSQFGVSKSWSVSLHGKNIDTVFFDQSMTADEVKRALVDHDGYDPAISVRRKTVRR